MTTRATQQEVKVPKRSLSAYLADFHTHFSSGIESITKAAKCYADAVREHSDKARNAFHKAYPAVTEATWEKLRLIGNGDMHPAIMLCTDRIGARLARLPMCQQKKLLDGRTHFRCVNRTTGEVESVALSDLKPRHERILFDGDKLRSVNEQRAYAMQMTESAKTVAGPPYVIEGGLLVVVRACRLGVNELKAIIKKIEEAR